MPLLPLAPPRTHKDFGAAALLAAPVERPKDPRFVAALALFGAILVEAAQQTAAVSSPASDRILRFLLFCAGSGFMPLFFLAGGWMAHDTIARSGGNRTLRDTALRACTGLAWGALLCSPLLIWSHNRPNALFAALPLILYLVFFEFAATLLRRNTFAVRTIRFLAPLGKKPAWLMSIPAAIFLFWAKEWHGWPEALPLLPGFQLGLYGLWFAMGWWAGSAPERFDKLSSRWFLRILLSTVFSAGLYAAQGRLNRPGQLQNSRRMFFCLTYALYSWRFVLALAGACRATRLKLSGPFPRVAEAMFCCYAIHVPWIAWAIHIVPVGEPAGVRFLLAVLAVVTLGWSTYELLVRRTALRNWLAWSP